MRQNAARSAEVYRQQQVMTATPEALTLMLYNGAIKFINESIEASKKKEYEKANTSCIKAQNIISEFRLTLKMEYEISKNLLALYNYAYDRLVEGNMNEDITKLEEAKDILSELRDAWAQAMKAFKNEKGGA
ncbi:MAG: flagellar export chaperone FliS [Negativicutes bacterium]|nr:flagellar export chaperone FliS [Negativicutes bacterium]